MRLAHDDEGSGAAVVLLHAGVADRRMWQAVAVRLAAAPAEAPAHASAAGLRTVRPDLRGFGDSPLPGEEYADADDVVALLDDLGIASAALVGSSFGGRVALEVAATHPTRVSTLVLLCPAWRGVEPDAEVRAFGEEEDALLEAGDVPAAVDLNVRTWLGPDAGEDAALLLAQMQRRAFEVQLAADGVEPPPRPRRVDVEPARVGAPALVVSGGHDLAHFRLVARTLGDLLPDARHVELPWAGHLPALERPDAVADLLLDAVPR